LARVWVSAAESSGAPAPAQDAAAFALGCAAPYALLDVILERVFEALLLHRALAANLLGGLDAEPVRREELAGVRATTTPSQHPRVFVGNLLHGPQSARLSFELGPGRLPAGRGAKEPTETRDLPSSIQRVDERQL